VSTKLVISFTLPSGPIVDTKTGQPTFAFTKFLQTIGNTISQAFNSQGAISPDSIPFPTAGALGGVLTAGPIDHQWVNAIDGTGTPTLSQPSFSDLSGTAAPSQSPALSALTGSVTPTQVPALSALNGSVTAAQVPPLSALSGQITSSQIPGGLGVSHTVTLAKLTTLGANGSITFLNGFATSIVDPT
jgi:hypothetical protein